MRIGIDARELAGEAAGVGRYLAELVARWTREAWATGHALVLFTPAPLAADAGWRGTGGAQVDVQVVDGAGGTLWEQGPLARRARSVNLDVFFAPGYTAPRLLGALPVVVAMHDVSFAAHPEWFRWREGMRQRALARITARRAARVVTLTRFSRDEIVRCLHVPATRIDVIAPAVDAHPALSPTPRREDRARTGGQPPRRDPLVLYVGSIFTRRHVPELVLAFQALARARHDARLALVGHDRTWPRQHISGCIERSGLAPRIEWHPWVSEGHLRSLYRQAQVFAFLSEYEGFGLPPLEALSGGIPPVVADVPVAHEAYGAAALYVDPRAPSAIADALSLAMDDDGTRQRILEAAPDVLGRYSWDVTARQTFDVIRTAAEATRR